MNRQIISRPVSNNIIPDAKSLRIHLIRISYHLGGTHRKWSAHEEASQGNYPQTSTEDQIHHLRSPNPKHRQINPRKISFLSKIRANPHRILHKNRTFPRGFVGAEYGRAPHEQVLIRQGTRAATLKPRPNFATIRRTECATVRLSIEFAKFSGWIERTHLGGLVADGFEIGHEAELRGRRHGQGLVRSREREEEESWP